MAHPRPADIEADVRRDRHRVGLTGRMRADGIPGLVSAAVVDGQPSWSRGHGLACVDDGIPVGADTVFQCCSLSKPVAAVGVLSLVAAGRVGLDEDVRPLLAYDIDRHRLYSGAAPAITVRRLLMHRNGITGRGTTPDKRGRRFVRGGGGSVRFPGTYDSPIPSIRDFWSGYKGRAGVMVTHAPDQQRSYSGLGYLVLEHLCEQLTGRRFGEWMDERILGPLGMTASTFDLDPRLGRPLACGHDSKGRVLPGRRELCPWSAAAGLYTTAGDMARFLAFLVNEGRVGSEVVLDRDLTVAMTTDGLCVTVAGRGHNRRFRHTGSNAGFRTILVGYPGPRGGVVVMANSGVIAAGGGVSAMAAATARAHRWPGAR
ncbi:MAG: serine hydrolase domain-containing protein [Acidimicrobiales bacterium]